MPSVPSIGFDLRPSRLLAAALVVVAVLAIVGEAFSGLPFWLRPPLGAGIAAYTVCMFVYLHKPPVAAALWHGDGSWTLRLAGGAETEARLRSARVLGPLIVLRLAWLPRGKAALVLLPDNLDADTRRRLRVRLSAWADSD